MSTRLQPTQTSPASPSWAARACSCRPSWNHPSSVLAEITPLKVNWSGENPASSISRNSSTASSGDPYCAHREIICVQATTFLFGILSNTLRAERRSRFLAKRSISAQPTQTPAAK
ncbi:unnamed protein product [Spirodela intermedia]|uniref:Uncharacterized protein n=1 Tax=Spirodela intermedia TaxID=51605 RepID=A0A7I8JS25_SPIIN|nr:unnamed protein product [Spirodela intermedia]CAA6672924.1 unnamed protein product [Spirodela intermedia]